MKRLLLIPVLTLSMALAACDIDAPRQGTQVEGMKQLEAQQQSLNDKIPAPVLTDSLERRNIAARLQRVNKANLNGYIYLISYGKVMAYYPVKGKISSLNSYLVPQEQVVSVRTPTNFPNWVGPMSAPDLDGSYGENDNGIFFFTTTDAYVEWNGEYLWSDQPLKVSQPPEMIFEIN